MEWGGAGAGVGAGVEPGSGQKQEEDKRSWGDRGQVAGTGKRGAEAGENREIYLKPYLLSPKGKMPIAASMSISYFQFGVNYYIRGMWIMGTNKKISTLIDTYYTALKGFSPTLYCVLESRKEARHNTGLTICTARTLLRGFTMGMHLIFRFSPRLSTLPWWRPNLIFGRVLCLYVQLRFLELI